MVWNYNKLASTLRAKMNHHLQIIVIKYDDDED